MDCEYIFIAKYAIGIIAAYAVGFLLGFLANRRMLRMEQS